MSTEILNDKFPSKPLPGSSEISNPPASSPLASRAISRTTVPTIPTTRERGPLVLRMAYGTFFLVRVLLALATLGGLPLNLARSDVVSDGTVLSTLATFALAVVFAIGRKSSVRESEYGKSLLAIFFAHGVITLTYLLYHSFIPRGLETPRSPVQEKSLSWIFIICNLFWVLCAAEAARCNKILF